MTMQVSCRRATELLSQQLDRPLSAQERVALQAHLLICRGCRAVDHQFRFLRDAIRTLADRGGGDGDGEGASRG